MKRKICLLLILVMTAAGIAMAQDAVRWRAFVKMTSETEGTLTVKALVTPGWHLYGTTLPKGGPKPTKIDFSASSGVKFVDGFKPSVQPVTKKDETFGITLNWWAENVTFTRNFKLTGPKADAVLKGAITYMACNDSNCTPPQTANFSLKIK